jgi:hypothetical protein
VTEEDQEVTQNSSSPSSLQAHTGYSFHSLPDFNIRRMSDICSGLSQDNIAVSGNKPNLGLALPFTERRPSAEPHDANAVKACLGVSS